MTVLAPHLVSSVAAIGRIVRASSLALLVLCEPLVGLVCVAISVLGVLASLVFESSAAGPTFPCLRMIGLSLSFVAVLALYSCVVALLLDKDH